ncbi:hypothetical protein PENARI_c068G03877 [Penicillium arizonense]|uniref:PSP1 C-terminal domain-containing protein n=1 Tax=Penicillium arizonense TaxID=1835702 RepID=A0A1F5L281_PENAI|nr:hypothetical protein PENARI_c068G03877 [Penicillium arizonense]OGE47069.1 hypothetical protein PENARI_c068G03877 [Penicillium arizonense]
MANPSPASGPLDDEMLNPITHTILTESDITCSIPLHLTPKTCCSQSSSVGQMSTFKPHARRPSVLRELRHDSASFGRVGDESLNNPDGDLSHPADQARTIEQLARENALLRQEVTGQDLSLPRIRGSMSKEDLVVEDLGELRDVQRYSNLGSNARRPFSEHSPDLEQRFSSFTTEYVRKSHRQTAPGFGSVTDIPLSRRHTFADIHMRHTSISSVDSHASATTPSGLRDRDEGYGNSKYFSDPSMLPQTFYPCGQTLCDECLSDIPLSPSRYAISGADDRQPQLLSHTQKNQLLYLVTFKCHRANVFYVQKDSDIKVKDGDLVIVEADRGTDLGTVQHVNVTIQKARELKQQYSQEHYKRLMFFSHQGQHEGPNLANAGLQILNTTGGMGTHANGVQETGADIKPKLIKRLAQNHEIEILRNKAGNEANAKRIGQQKVAEHRLNIQILDAELQMDWKKLTFYYFADSYINFNSLVADLFKVYKTRIWMSAINPAAFVMPPTAGLQGPGGLSNPLYRQDEQYTDCRHLYDGLAYSGVPDAVNTQCEGRVNQVGMLCTAYNEPYEPFAQPSRQVAAAQTDAFTQFSPATHDDMEMNPSDYLAGNAGSSCAACMHPTRRLDWPIPGDIAPLLIFYIPLLNLEIILCNRTGY